MGVDCGLFDRLEFAVQIVGQPIGPLEYESSCVPQVPAHQHPRAVQLALRSSRRDVEERANFTMLVAFHVVEHENLTRAGRQLFHRMLEVDPEMRRRRFGS